jgi:hypothetical protein
MSEEILLIPASNITKCPATYHRENIDLENNPITGEQITPIIVRPSKTHAPKLQMFERVTGDRRYKKEVNERGLNGLIKCIVRDLTDEEAMEISVKDNEQRKELTLYEKASQVVFYLNFYKDKLQAGKMFEMDIGDMLGCSPSTFSQLKKIGENLTGWFGDCIKYDIMPQYIAVRLLDSAITNEQRQSISLSLIKKEMTVSQATKEIDKIKSKTTIETTTQEKLTDLKPPKKPSQHGLEINPSKELVQEVIDGKPSPNFKITQIIPPIKEAPSPAPKPSLQFPKNYYPSNTPTQPFQSIQASIMKKTESILQKELKRLLPLDVYSEIVRSADEEKVSFDKKFCDMFMSMYLKFICIKSS